jgi:hypothetical protein
MPVTSGLGAVSLGGRTTPNLEGARHSAAEESDVLTLTYPFRSEPSGRAPRRVPLLLVIHRGAADLFARRIGSARGDRAAFAVGGDDNATGNSNGSTLLHI